MSGIDITQNRTSLIEACKDVCNQKSSTTWLIFGYQGTTSVLKVVDKGDSDFDEFVEEFNSGAIQYGFYRIVDKNTNLFKYILIHWQGEGVPELLKGKFAGHIHQVKTILKPVHFTVIARSEDDIDYDDILDKVAKAGSNYSIHKEERKPIPEPKPVGSVYQRTNAAVDIKKSKRGDFWTKQQDEEKKRVEDEKHKKQEVKKTLDEETKLREAQEAEKREKDIEERVRKISISKQNDLLKEKEAKETELKKWQETEKLAELDAEQERQQHERQRHDKAAEAGKLVKMRQQDPKSMWQEDSQFPSQFPSSTSSIPSPKEPVKETKTEIERIPSDSADPGTAVVEGESSNKIETEVPVPLPQAPIANTEPEEQVFEEQPPPPEPTPAAAVADDTIRAKALYDYQAEDEGELSFDPGDIITNIEKIDPGWWTGYGPNGSFGMFPANYVEEE